MKTKNTDERQLKKTHKNEKIYYVHEMEESMTLKYTILPKDLYRFNTITIKMQ